MEEFIGYMVFSLVEGLALYAIIFYSLRIDLIKHLLPVIGAITVINLQSYIIREELSLSTISPVINLLITAIFIIVYLRIPLAWSLIMTIVGYIAFGLLQTAIVYLSFGFFSIHELSNLVWKSYLLQVLTGFIGFGLSYLTYKFGYGFTFELEKLRLRKEKILVSMGIASFILALLVIMLYKSVFSNLVVFAVFMFLAVIYYQRKDTEA
ncbi:hypothetical protein SAMN05216312_102195 [Cohnella sp. OV330]|uniref:hypothetical protein n=1 Tax=Cohnella sp. OV330 TaxID=1855288 RepID=UPI0008F10F28|nr:hypothetical protein [Cohnella sp. OV330]SFA91217.1 hypothetical protein SAMN05216312_102195 [Cohnella sp. OV330]